MTAMDIIPVEYIRVYSGNLFVHPHHSWNVWWLSHLLCQMPSSPYASRRQTRATPPSPKRRVGVRRSSVVALPSRIGLLQDDRNSTGDMHTVAENKISDADSPSTISSSRQSPSLSKERKVSPNARSSRRFSRRSSITLGASPSEKSSRSSVHILGKKVTTSDIMKFLSTFSYFAQLDRKDLMRIAFKLKLDWKLSGELLCKVMHASSLSSNHFP